MTMRTIRLGLAILGLLLTAGAAAFGQLNISNSPSVPSINPRMATDSQGNVHSIWIERNNYPFGDVYYARGDFSTQQISSPINLSNSASVYCDTMEMCAIAVDGSNRVYALWTEGWDPDCSLKLRIYSNGSWGAPYTVTTGLRFRTPRIAVTSAGDIYLVFWDFQWKVRSTARVNGQWESVRLLGSESEIAKMADIDVGTNVVGVTMSKKGGGSDIYQTAYLQRGKGFNAAWSEPTLVAPAGYDEIFNSIRIDSNDTAHMTWMYESGSSRIVLYAQKNASGFTSPISVSDWGMLHFSSMTKNGDDVFVVWQSGGYGYGTGVQYNSRLSDGSWGGVHDVPNSAGVTYSDMAVAPNGSALYFVWDTLLDLGNGEIYGWAVASSTALAVSSLTPTPALPQGTGTPITWKAVTRGGTAPVQYRFYLYSGNTNSWSLGQDYSAADTWTWTPTQAGQYAVQVWARNAGSSANYDAWKSSGYFNISGSSVLNVTALTPSPAPPQGVGTAITWTASATGGTAPLQYKFWLYSAGAWTMVRDYAASNSYTWTPSQPGQYAVQVWVRNAGSTASYDAWKGSGYFNITGSALALTALTPSPAPPQGVGTAITWTAAAAGGTAPLQYQFWLYGASGWQMLRDYSTSNTWTWTPSQPGQYAVQVWVRNAGSTASYDAWKGSGYFNITGAALAVSSLTPSPAPPLSAGTPIIWTATASGGTAPLQYQFWLYSAAGWQMVRDYSTANSWTWTPSQPGQYAVQVWVRNAGSTARYDAWRGSGYFDITASPAPSEASLPSPDAR